jgi:hypothetical protein
VFESQTAAQRRPRADALQAEVLEQLPCDKAVRAGPLVVRFDRLKVEVVVVGGSR